MTDPIAAMAVAWLGNWLPQDERGNVWLHDETTLYQELWLRLPTGRDWLRVSLQPEQSPGVRVSLERHTPEGLAAYIRANYGGWSVGTCPRDVHLPLAGGGNTRDQTPRGELVASGGLPADIRIEYGGDDD